MSAALFARASPSMTTLFQKQREENFEVQETAFVCTNLDAKCQIEAHLLMCLTMWKRSGPERLGENLCNTSASTFS